MFFYVQWLTMDGSKSLREVKKEFFKNLISLNMKVYAYFFPLERKVYCGLSNLKALNMV